MIRALALAASLAIAQPASAGFWDNYYAAQGGYIIGGGLDAPPQRMSCGLMGLDSSGVCRSGILGAIDQSVHGVCVIDRRTMSTRCER